MDLWKRVLIFATFILFSCGIALISTALATDRWFSARPTFNSSSLSSIVDENRGSSVIDDSTTTSLNRFRQGSVVNNENLVHGGLFNGIRMLDFGLGVRSTSFTVRDELRNGDSFMSMGLWVTVILFAVLALLWGVVGIVFALINTVIVPYETITGPLGLYLWSSLAVLCTFISILLFVVQYYTSIFYDVLLKEQSSVGYTSSGSAQFDYSFWMMLGALGAFAANILLLLLSGLETKTKYASNEKETTVDNGVLMY